ncbi:MULTISPECIES: ParA family protein [Curtobacterium]|jgi:chromosome partitioning protein|uniref:ParA family protein n=2 Tax=Curtobacterium TaxID=2034 RepID=A0A5P8YVU5_9MICO|nr:ParA family protein [Curtobacterium flaccumfaciens]MBO9041446.1 ParA family protein [Curtobacterium flaccumfaciens pv. flaccumfaciens]MBO9044932.1 ParA family protein [Curtobacterium flaccumfaciens pv. flaccumfaciens]MBO9048925.1 ParA family protein [Curtobacterium flaccumfaciens pv. flaccumfaciens]MBO9057776.1 ParA family protein [Curtobacterium flaccumfaciens pv. flaccumfaciens]MBT1543215.1 ParA family protein [Curtobacterium flaccumfaciens pv. flaccumfaciens]
MPTPRKAAAAATPTAPWIVAIAMQKGGVGKTTTTMGLAAVLSETCRVLVVDIDPQGSVTFWAERAGDNLPFDFAADLDPNNLARLRELPYDVIIVDTPGSLESTHILTPVLDEADFVIAPTEAEALSIDPLRKTIETLIVPRGLDYRVLINKYDPRTPQDLEDIQELVDQIGLRRFQNAVRRYKSHSKAPIDGLVVTQYRASRNDLKASEDFRRIAMELLSIRAMSPRTVQEDH